MTLPYTSKVAQESRNQFNKILFQVQSSRNSITNGIVITITTLWNLWSYRSDYKPNTKLTLFTRENIVFMDTEETKWDLVLNNLIHF